MPPIFLHWPTMLEVDAGDMVVEAEPSFQYTLHFVHVQHGLPPCGKN